MPRSIFFKPFTLKSLTLSNRFVMAPMTRSFSPGGVPDAQVAAYYRRRAEGQVGLILTEGTAIDRPAAVYHPDIPHFHGQAALEGWQQVVHEVHAAGGKIAPQLWHVGVIPPAEASPLPQSEFEGPSGVLDRTGQVVGKAVTDKDIEAIIAAYAQAAADAQRLGFDTLEIHGAHGYLIDQFFWDATNRRSDHWGGSTLAQRSRLAVEVIKAVRQAVTDDFVILLRLSQWKANHYDVRLAATPQEMSDWLLPLSEAGVDIFHCSQRRFWEPEFEGSDLNFAGWAKKITGKPTITVGSVGLSQTFTESFQGESSLPTPIDALQRRLEKDEFDLVAVGRALISDPHWVAKLGAGQDDQWVGFEKSALGSLL